MTAATTIVRQPALASSPQPTPTARALIAQCTKGARPRRRPKNASPRAAGWKCEQRRPAHAGSRLLGLSVCELPSYSRYAVEIGCSCHGATSCTNSPTAVEARMPFGHTTWGRPPGGTVSAHHVGDALPVEDAHAPQDSPLPIETVNHESHHALGRLTRPPKS